MYRFYRPLLFVKPEERVILEQKVPLSDPLSKITAEVGHIENPVDVVNFPGVCCFLETPHQVTFIRLEITGTCLDVFNGCLAISTYNVIINWKGGARN